MYSWYFYDADEELHFETDAYATAEEAWAKCLEVASEHPSDELHVLDFHGNEVPQPKKKKED